MPTRLPSGVALDSLALTPRIRWDQGLRDNWRPGEASALAQLDEFCAVRLAAYPDGRNRPDHPATSRLSPHLHFGELSPLQVLATTLRVAHERRTHGIAAGKDVFLKEIGWREFAYHLLYHYPDTATQPMDARFAAMPWQQDERFLEIWQRGMTGYPIVDAGMRELWHTGWMHNRVRMVVASLLTKNLQQPWLAGARWFWDTLVDADLASNTLGWQWTAGCGADAAPYYRIFNPILQTERFDIERGYLRRWVPELARLPDEWIHQPWAAPATVLQAAGVIPGATYPQPLVDFRSSRDAALAAWSQIKGIR
jgi:deoxyribodipyrimidine photo-lyase